MTSITTSAASSNAARKPLPTSRMRRWINRRSPGGPDAGVALLMVLMMILVATSLSLLLLGSVVNAVHPTLATRKQVRTVHAAEAGMNVVLGQVRVATKIDPLDATKMIGDRTQLPCTTTAAPIIGQVGGEDGNISYSVNVRYYRVDPTGQTEAWRSNAANLIVCGPLVAEQARYALITSVGKGDTPPSSNTATSGDRTAEVVYSFKTDNTNALGGAIYMNGKCFDAVTTTPASGANVALSPCVVGQVTQKFWWRDDDTIVMVSTLTTTPMCLTADPTGSTAHTVQLYPCDGLSHQAWGLDDTSPPKLYMLKSGSTTKYCAQDTGTGYLMSSTACGYTIDIDQGVGAGRAGYPPSTVADTAEIQWVNYSAYGRCIDINGWNINNDVILWPCKQEPNTTVLRWNQGIYWDDLYPSTTHQSWLYSWYGSSGQTFPAAQAAGSTQICLSSKALNTALRFSACSGTDPQMKWIVNRDTGNYDTSYTIVDNVGNCLDTGPPTATTGTLTSLRVQACSGTESQKWNAPPTFNKAKQKDFQEITGQ